MASRAALREGRLDEPEGAAGAAAGPEWLSACPSWASSLMAASKVSHADGCVRVPARVLAAATAVPGCFRIRPAFALAGRAPLDEAFAGEAVVRARQGREGRGAGVRRELALADGASLIAIVASGGGPASDGLASRGIAEAAAPRRVRETAARLGTLHVTSGPGDGTPGGGGGGGGGRHRDRRDSGRRCDSSGRGSSDRDAPMLTQHERSSRVHSSLMGHHVDEASVAAIAGSERGGGVGGGTGGGTGGGGGGVRSSCADELELEREIEDAPGNASILYIEMSRACDS